MARLPVAGEKNWDKILNEYLSVAHKPDGTPIQDSSFGPNDGYINVKDYGALGNNATNDTTAINNALAAAANLVTTTGRGAVVFFPAGEYMTSGGHTLPAFCHILGSEPAGRYWGYNATNMPRATCALKLIAGSAPTAMFVAPANFEAGSVRDISLLGNNSGTNTAGLDFSSCTLEENLIVENVAIIGFSGNGVQGHLLATRWSNLFVGGNKKYGMSSTGTLQWTDSWFSNCIFNGNVKGGVNFDATVTCGEIMFLQCRFERSGWNPATPGSAGVPPTPAPGGVGAPGIRIQGNLAIASFVSCSTDANSGNGLEIIRPSTAVNAHHINFTGCRFNRDGWGTGVAPIQSYAGVKISGASPSSSVDYISFTNCLITEGRANDVVTQPTYTHPKYGVWCENANYWTWHGGGISEGITGGQFYGGTAGWAASNWRPSIIMPGAMGQMVMPVWTTGTQPTAALKGSIGFNESLNRIEVFNGTAWKSLTPV